MIPVHPSVPRRLLLDREGSKGGRMGGTRDVRRSSPTLTVSGRPPPPAASPTRSRLSAVVTRTKDVTRVRGRHP